MGRVYSLHMVALKHGASAEEFERLWCEEFLPGPQVPGITWRLLRGDRGDRAGKFLVMVEFESAELRTHHFPLPGPDAGQFSPEMGQWFGARMPVLEKWGKLATPLDVIYTDYVEVA